MLNCITQALLALATTCALCTPARADVIPRGLYDFGKSYGPALGKRFGVEYGGSAVSAGGGGTVNAGFDSLAPVAGSPYNLNASCSGYTSCEWTDDAVGSVVYTGGATCTCDDTSCDKEVQDDTEEVVTHTLTCDATGSDGVDLDWNDNDPTVDAGTDPGDAVAATDFQIDDLTVTDPDVLTGCQWSESDADGTCTFSASGACANQTACRATNINCDTGSVTMTLALTCDGVADTVDVPIAAGGGSGITVDLVASRTSGAAPLAVCFNAKGTTATGVVTPEIDLFYLWDFDEGTLGGWGYVEADGSHTPVGATKSWDRGMDAGVVTCHTFMTAGSYDVGLTVVGPGGTETDGVTITVTAADDQWATTDTICVDPATDFTGCPSGATQVTSSDFDSACNTYADTDRRILFHRGEGFAADATCTIDFPGPFMIGSYGTGNLPTVAMSANLPLIDLDASGGAGDASDIRITELNTTGPGTGTANRAVHVADGIVDHLLIQDIMGTDWHNCIQLAGDQNEPHTNVVISQTNCVSNGFGAGGQTYMLLLEGAAFVGNFGDDSTAGEQVTRVSHAIDTQISHNYLARAATDKHVLDVRCEIISLGVCQNWVMLDNESYGGAHDIAWNVGNGSASHFDESEQIYAAFNFFQVYSGETDLDFHAVFYASHVRFANNVMDMSGSPGVGANFGRLGNDPAHVDVYAYGNTCYSSDNPGGGEACVRLGCDGAADDVSESGLSNNWFVGDATAGIAVTTNSGCTTDITINSGSNIESTLADADLATEPPTLWAHFKPTATSPVVDTGGVANVGPTSTLPIDHLPDAALLQRVANSTIDPGAFEYNAASYP